jgi:hypothetical protein
MSDDGEEYEVGKYNYKQFGSPAKYIYVVEQIQRAKVVKKGARRVWVSSCTTGSHCILTHSL